MTDDGLDKYQRYRARHPERVRALQKLVDSRPERKERQKLRARRKRLTPEYKAWNDKYERSPDRVAKRVAASKTQRVRAIHARHRSKPEAKKKHAERMRRARSTPSGRMENRMRVAIRRGISRGSSKTLIALLGYTVAELVAHIERQFLPGMSWEEAAEWHIDHIVPLSLFNIREYGDVEFKAAWGLPNLRPMWAIANLSKRANRLTLL
jgi:hypothetical protein